MSKGKGEMIFPSFYLLILTLRRSDSYPSSWGAAFCPADAQESARFCLFRSG